MNSLHNANPKKELALTKALPPCLQADPERGVTIRWGIGMACITRQVAVVVFVCLAEPVCTAETHELNHQKFCNA